MTNFKEISEEEMMNVNGGNAVDGAIAIVAEVGTIAGLCQCYPVAIVCTCVVAGYTIGSAFTK